MNRFIKKATVLWMCLMILCAGLFSACGLKADDEQITYLVGVSQANLIDPRQIALKEDIESEAGQYPDIKVLYADAGSSNEKQKSDIEDMLTQQVDIIIIFPNDVQDISDVLQKAYETGVGVILLGYPTDTVCYSTRIYTDHYQIGMMAGEYASKLLGGHGTVLEIQGDPDNLMSTERKNGFMDAISPDPQIVKEYVCVGYWSRDNAESVLDNSGLLDRELQTDLVFAHNDEMAIGAAKLIESKDLDIFIIGVDGLGGSNRGIDAVKTGKIDATIVYPTGGKEAVEYAMKFLSGEEIPAEIALEPQLVTVENANDF